MTTIPHSECGPADQVLAAGFNETAFPTADPDHADPANTDRADTTLPGTEQAGTEVGDTALESSALPAAAGEGPDDDEFPYLTALTRAVERECTAAALRHGFDAEHHTHAVVAAVMAVRDARLESERTRTALYERIIKRSETQHVTFLSGADLQEVHPDWCRECRVDQARAGAVPAAVRDAGGRLRRDVRGAINVVYGELGGPDDTPQDVADVERAIAADMGTVLDYLALPAGTDGGATDPAAVQDA